VASFDPPPWRQHVARHVLFGRHISAWAYRWIESALSWRAKRETRAAFPPQQDLSRGFSRSWCLFLSNGWSPTNATHRTVASPGIAGSIFILFEFPFHSPSAPFCKRIQHHGIVARIAPQRAGFISCSQLVTHPTFFAIFHHCNDQFA
jgi:hypothetical protein